MLRWSLTENSVSRSTSSPHRSMRIGASAVRREHVDDRAAAGDLAAVLDQLLAAVADVHEPGRAASSGSSMSPWADADRLDRRWRPGRAAAAGPARRRRRSPGIRSGVRRRHRTSSRRPMVSTLGLTRSNGRVSHAGNSTTSPAGMYWTRSSYSWPASVPVGQATTRGRRPPSWASAAIAMARAASGTATSPLRVAEGLGERRLVAEQRGQFGERHLDPEGTHPTPR